MAHAIIFTDRPPATQVYDGTEWNKRFYGYPAGAYKIASELRVMGMKALVIPNCSALSFAGLKQIIEQNKKDLLWVGISTTLFFTKSSQLTTYRQQWAESQDNIIDNCALYSSVNTYTGPTELIWAGNEINQIAQYLKHTADVPLLIGGAFVTNIYNGNLENLHDNAFIVPGRAEQYVRDFSLQKLKDKNHQPPFVNNNNRYDDTVYKNSIIQWESTDHVTADDWLPLEISRGCAFNCGYCDHDKKSTFDSYKHPETLRQELIRNYELFGVTKYNLVDDLYNDSKQKVRELYDKVWSKLPFEPEWTSYMRLDMFWADPESIQIVRASGARLGAFGIETLHDRAGRKVGKGLGKQRIIETLTHVRECWQDECLVIGLFIAGLPYEPLDSIKETMAWTSTTNLLHSANYTPMWITPPAHRMMVTNPTDISSYNDKYGIRWLTDNNWINTEGVTFVEADRLVDQYRRTVNKHAMKINFAPYADFRTAGLSHYELLDISQVPKQRLVQCAQNLNKKIDFRLQANLELCD